MVDGVVCGHLRKGENGVGPPDHSQPGHVAAAFERVAQVMLGHQQRDQVIEGHNSPLGLAPSARRQNVIHLQRIERRHDVVDRERQAPVAAVAVASPPANQRQLHVGPLGRQRMCRVNAHRTDRLRRQRDQRPHLLADVAGDAAPGVQLGSLRVKADAGGGEPHAGLATSSAAASPLSASGETSTQVRRSACVT